MRRWLRDKALTYPDLGTVLGALGHQWNAEGIPITRQNCHLQFVDPLVSGVSYTWRRGMDAAEGMQVRAAVRQSQRYQNSPTRLMVEGDADMYRRPLVDLDPLMDFPILIDLKREGATDYIAVSPPVPSARGTCFTLATDQPGGFTDDQIAQILRTGSLLGPVLDVFALRHIGASLLSAYLGSRTGRDVFSGALSRGALETVHGVILFTDLRQSTRLSQMLEPQAYVDALNDFFAPVGSAIANAGGEVVKFVGDGALSLFQTDSADPFKAAERAVSASTDLLQRLATISDRREAAGHRRLDCGIGLHVGDVLYATVGSDAHRDIAVTGSAVNLAMRLQKLSREIGNRVLASAEFVALSPEMFECAGEFEISGFSGRRAVYRLSSHGTMSW